MGAESGRQATRVARRRNGQRQSTAPAEIWYADDRVSADERRHALMAMIVLGLVFVGICVAYVVLAAGEILG